MKINWFNLENSKELENQVKYNIACACEGYLNGCHDCGYEKMTKDEWREYILFIMNDTFETGSGTDLGMSAAKHLRFYGKANTVKLINYYLDNYDDVQEFIA